MQVRIHFLSGSPGNPSVSGSLDADVNLSVGDKIPWHKPGEPESQGWWTVDSVFLRPDMWVPGVPRAMQAVGWGKHVFVRIASMKSEFDLTHPGGRSRAARGGVVMQARIHFLSGSPGNSSYSFGSGTGGWRSDTSVIRTVVSELSLSVGDRLPWMTDEWWVVDSVFLRTNMPDLPVDAIFIRPASAESIRTTPGSPKWGKHVFVRRESEPKVELSSKEAMHLLGDAW